MLTKAKLNKNGLSFFMSFIKKSDRKVIVKIVLTQYRLSWKRILDRLNSTNIIKSV